MYAAGLEFPLDGQRAVQVLLHAASPLTVMLGESPGGIDLTRYVRSCRQGPSEATISFAWHDELYGDTQPRAGLVVEIVLQGASYWIGIVQAVNDYRVASGERSMSIVARSRDATPAWRDTRRTTDIYPTATPLSYIAHQVAQAAGLSPNEINLQDTGTSTVHSNTQLADLTPWQMLTTLYQATGLEPYIDCRGALKLISRDLGRQPDIVVSDTRRVLSVGGSKALPSLTELRVNWLDPNLTESAQQNRMLDRASITAGFFQLKQEYNVRFSPDSTQRARSTYLVIKQSANSGLLPVASESYAQSSPTAGKITLRTSAWVPLLTTGAMVAKFIAHNTPDIAPPGGGPVVPVGRRLEYAADAVLFLTMMSVGTGQYEVWGTPYDYVHARNTTTAYNSSAQPWEIKPEEIENDFVVNEAQAQSFAIRELIYRSRAAMSYTLTMVDDTRVERGDLIELADGSRIYVTDYSRDLSHGAEAVLSVSGFIATIGNVVAGRSTTVVIPVAPGDGSVGGGSSGGGGVTAPAPPPPTLLLTADAEAETGGVASASVVNQGATAGAWSVASGAAGLSALPSSGTVAAGAVQPLVLLCTQPGEYQLTLTNASGGGVFNSPAAITVSDPAPPPPPPIPPPPAPPATPLPAPNTTVFRDGFFGMPANGSLEDHTPDIAPDGFAWVTRQMPVLSDGEGHAIAVIPVDYITPNGVRQNQLAYVASYRPPFGPNEWEITLGDSPYRVQVRLRHTTAGTTTTSPSTSLDFGKEVSGGTDGWFGLQIQHDSVQINSSFAVLYVSLPVGQWFDVAVDIDPSSAANNCIVSVNGISLAVFSIANAPTAINSVGLAIGAPNGDGTWNYGQSVIDYISLTAGTSMPALPAAPNPGYPTAAPPPGPQPLPDYGYIDISAALDIVVTATAS